MTPDLWDLRVSLERFLPELILCGTIVTLLLVRLLRAFNRMHLGWLALPGTLVALVFSLRQWLDPLPNEDFFLSGPREMFSGLLVYDNFTIFLRIFLLVA